MAAPRDTPATHGYAKQLLADPEAQVEVPGLGDRGPRMLSRQALAGVIEPRVEEIFSLVHQVMLEDHADLRGYEAYVCGSVKMVESAVPDFLARGLAEEACYSDAFNPARPGEATDSGRASD